MKKESKRRATRPKTKTTADSWRAAREPLLKPFDFTGWGYQMPALGVAEARAQLFDEGAAYFEKSRREALASGNTEGAERLADLARDDRERAAWWRALADADPEARQSYDEWLRIAGEHIDCLLARGEKDDGVKLNLLRVLGQLHCGLHALAAHGNEWAARLLVSSLSEAVNAFEMLATTKPELFDFLRDSFGIPAIISPSREKTADNQRLVKQLHVGEKYQFAILPTGKPGKKWKFQDRANGLAARLQSYIESHRTLFEVHKLEAQHAGRELPSWLHVAKELEPFSVTSWRTWADIAWRVIAEISPEQKPERHAAFYDRATKICNVRTRRTESFPTFTGGDVIHDSPSIAEHDIKEALFSAFELIATGSSRRTMQRQKSSPTIKKKTGK